MKQLQGKAFSIFCLVALSMLPSLTFAADATMTHSFDMSHHMVGVISLAVFILAYILVAAEEFTQLRKSKPVILAAGIIWAAIGYAATQHGFGDQAEQAARRNFLDYAELMLFLLVAMTYINAMEERQVFNALRAWLVHKGYGFRTLFWMTGTLAFFISPIADNMTTALLMCAVVMAVGGDNVRFVSLACINIVIGANAGGAYSPFGDITTLMVWQKGVVGFYQFFDLFIPATVNFVVPALIMQFAIPNEKPHSGSDTVTMRPGAIAIIFLFLLTIVTAVSFHNFLDLPPVMGMLTGLGYLQLCGFVLRRKALARASRNKAENNEAGNLGDIVPFDVFNKIARAEWDTLLFFYGVVMCVGGLGYIGYLQTASHFMYQGWSATTANVSVGLMSSVIDNIPVMFAVLTMHPDMSLGQWLLVTMTAGVGGSLLSIGSAAGVALMGQTQGKYTFFSHLRWTPVIALGYAASIATHMWVNASLFHH